MLLLIYIDDCLMFSTSKDKIDYIYASLKGDFRIGDNGYLNM